jgi:hypothetical protein
MKYIDRQGWLYKKKKSNILGSLFSNNKYEKRFFKFLVNDTLLVYFENENHH